MVNTNKLVDLPVNVFHNLAGKLKNLFLYIPLYCYITMANKWADLPVDVLIQILKHSHDSKTDLTRLRGVCSSWRSALPLEEHLTYTSHIQVPSIPVGMDRRPLFLLETAFYFFSPLNRPREGSSNPSGWVARMYQIAPNKWRLLNPLSYDCRFELTDGNEYVFTDPPIVGKINLLDCRVFMFSKALILVDDLDLNAKPISTKVVGEWDLTSSTRPLSPILVLLGPDYVAGLSSRLLLLRPNDAQNQEIEWSEINVSAKGDRNQHNFMVQYEIAYSNGIFFVFQANGGRWRLGKINPTNETLMLKPFASGGIRMPFSNIALVPSKSNNDGLYLLVSPESGDIQCHFFGDESKRKNMKNFKDEMLFWSNYASFSIPTSTLDSNDPLLGRKSLAICQMFSKDALLNDFTIDDYYFDTYVWPKGMEFKYPLYKENISLWVLDIEKDIYDEPILDFDNENQFTLLYLKLMPEKPREVYKRLFFPPPTCVKWRCPSLHNVEIKLDELPDYAHEDDNFGYASDF